MTRYHWRVEMRSFLLIPVFIAVSALIASAQAAQSSSTLEQTLRTLDKQWFDAFLKGDGAAMEKFEAPDLVIVQPDGSLFSKTAPRSSTRRGQPNRTRQVLEFRVRSAGDVAVVEGVAEDRIVPRLQRTRFTEVWKRDKGQWRVWSYQATPMPARRPPPRRP